MARYLTDSVSLTLATSVLEWFVQSTVLLGFGLLAGRGLERFGAAHQSAAYRTALLAALGCPIVSHLLAVADIGIPLTGLISSLAGESSAPVGPAARLGSFNLSTQSNTHIINKSQSSTSASLSAPAPAITTGPSSSRAINKPSPSPFHFGSLQLISLTCIRLAFATWFLVALWLLSHIALAQRQLLRLRSSSVAVDHATAAVCGELAAEMGLRAPAVSRTPFLTSPCLVGFWWPAILLPEDCKVGLRETFIHELTHLARRDPLWNLAHRTATALFWIQPLFRSLSNRLAATAEDVCDDAVLRHGADSAQYAAGLLALAQLRQPPLASASVAIIASSSSLDRRIRRILDNSRRLTSEPARRALLAIAFVGCAITPLAGLIVVRPASPTPAAEPKNLGNPMTFHGRVIDKDTGTPIAGAEIVVTLSLPTATDGSPLSWARDTAQRTDADGRFTIVLSPEQVADRRLRIAPSRISHPDYIARKCDRPVSLDSLSRESPQGHKTFFDTIRLERGLEYHGQVVTPDGKPAAGVPFWFECWQGDNKSDHFHDDSSGRTDADGCFRLRLSRARALAIWMTPDQYAPFQRFWGTAHPTEEPQVYAPTDLGRLELTPGFTIRGRLLDQEGRPLAGQALSAIGLRNRFNRITTTDPAGRFAFAPLRPGNYAVYGEGQGSRGGIDPIPPPIPPDAAVIRPAHVYLDGNSEPAPLELKAASTVRVKVHFVDSQGNPAPGSPIILRGSLPGDHPSAEAADSGGPDRYDASRINDPEPNLAAEPIAWMAQLISDTSGMAVFQAPAGLLDADLSATPISETQAYKTRTEPSGLLRFWGGARLGTLDHDRGGIEIVSYRAPTVLVTVTTEGGEPLPEDTQVHLDFTSGGGSYGGVFTRLPDGRFQSRCMMPDHDYIISARANGYVTLSARPLSLPEAATMEIALTIRKK